MRVKAEDGTVVIENDDPDRGLEFIILSPGEASSLAVRLSNAAKKVREHGR